MSVEDSPPGYSSPLTAGTSALIATVVWRWAGLNQVLNQCA
jgi:hypothetical protein